MRSDEEQTSLGAPMQRIKKLVETARVPAGIREYIDSSRMISILREPDLSLLSVSPGLKCWGPF